jgi:hypothetical protein
LRDIKENTMRKLRAILALLLLAGMVSIAAGQADKPADKPAKKPTTQPADKKEQPPRTPTRPKLSRKEIQRRMRIAKRMQELIALFGKKDYAGAKKISVELTKQDPETGTHWYNLACANSRLGETDEAVANLSKAVDLGFDSMAFMERDPDLESLRDLKAFKKILARRDEIHRGVAEKRLASLKERYGEDYIIEIDHANKLVFATNVDRKTLDDLQNELTRQAEAIWGELFPNHFERYISVVIPKPGSFRARMGVAGFYNPMTNSLVASSIGMVLRHEFTHALHFGDQSARGQQHPVWVLEGLATLFETSDYEGTRLVPKDSRRLLSLQMQLKRKRIPSLKTMMEWTHPQFMQRAAAGYPMSRYFMMYLYSQGKLRTWYDAYTAGYEDDRTGKAATEKVFGKDIEDVDADWRKWAAAIKAPDLYVRDSQPYMGILSRPLGTGLELMRVVEGSGAAKGGLKKGDVIVKINGQRTIDPADLLRQVKAGKVGDKLAVVYRRDDEQHETEVVLSPKPTNLDRLPPTRTTPPKPDKEKPAATPARNPDKKKPAADKPTPSKKKEDTRF